MISKIVNRHNQNAKAVGIICVISNLEINLDKDNDNASPNFSGISITYHPNDGRLRKIERVTHVNNVHGFEEKTP